MPLFDEGGNTGESYQTAWEAFTGLFDKDRRKPIKDHRRPEDKDEQDLQLARNKLKGC